MKRLPAQDPIGRVLGLPGPLEWQPGSVQDIAGRRCLGAVQNRPGWTVGRFENPAAPLVAQHYTGSLAFGEFPQCLWANVYWDCGDGGTWSWFVKDERPESRRPGGFNDKAAASDRKYTDVAEAMADADAELDRLAAA